MKHFESTHGGKWILTGEHSVLLGFPALVFPLRSLSLQLRFSTMDSKHSHAKRISSPQEKDISSIMKKMLHIAQEYIKKDIILPRGRFRVESSIPISAGLGSSSAFCSCFGKFLLEYNYIKEEELYMLCRKMECLFHGESSGMDLYVVLTEKAVDFQIAKSPRELTLAWKPKLFLSDTCIRSNTSKCVKEVFKKRGKEKKASIIDERMGEASKLASSSLETKTNSSFSQLAQAINLAHSCFQDWYLSPPKVEAKIAELKTQGAKAVKVTGSGMGGFLLSLWEEEPSTQYSLLPVFSKEDISPIKSKFPLSVWEIDI